MNLIKAIRLRLHALRLSYYDFRAPLLFHHCDDGQETLLHNTLFDSKGKVKQWHCPNCQKSVIANSTNSTDFRDTLDDALGYGGRNHDGL